MIDQPDYIQLIKEARKITDNTGGFKEIKLAVLGDCSTQQYTQVLKACLFRQKIYAHIYESEFDVIDQEILDPHSGLFQFSPDFILLHQSTQKLRDDYYASPASDLVTARLNKTLQWWKVIRDSLKARIVQNLYVLPLERPFGNYSIKVEGAWPDLVDRLNHRLIESARADEHVLLNDADYLAALVGRKVWFDETIWAHAKVFCHLDCLPAFAQNTTQLISAALGFSKKCLVLDLDNTLWGGIVGEDGIEGLEIGSDGLGRTFRLFQCFLRDLKNRGLVLAVCSKNDPQTALEVFRRHPDMVLKEDDFAVFVANWEPKSENIRAIARTLNLGLDAVAFIDDSPFERNEVRMRLPEVLVPEMPEDPAEFVPYLNSLGIFEATTFSDEDRHRTRYYRDEAVRGQQVAKFNNIDDYLISLEMEAVFARFDEFHLPRIVQLIARSNQFNLTTRRYNEQQCREFMNNPQKYAPFYVTLKDKFGDSGLIGVIILEHTSDKVIIDTWLMSCRVLKRGVEDFLMNCVVEFATECGAGQVEGVYLPTAKNKMVEGFLGMFGFEKTDSSRGGQATWQLDVRHYVPRKNYIAKKEKIAWPQTVLTRS